MNKIEIVNHAIWSLVEEAPHHEVIVKDNWVQKVTLNAPAPNMNGVYKCEIDDGVAEEKVIETIKFFKDRKLPFRWKTCESSRPKNINYLLEKHGLVLKDELYGLISMPNQLDINHNSDVIVRELSLDMKKDWLIVQATAWRVPEKGIEYIDKFFEKELELMKGKSKSYIAYIDDVPVASASTIFFENYAYLVGAATAPEYRGRGIYKSLLKRRISEIDELNIPTVIHCVKDTSAPICLKLGFEKVSEIKSYELEL
mgnify:CR=1 FL=1